MKSTGWNTVVSTGNATVSRILHGTSLALIWWYNGSTLHRTDLFTGMDTAGPSFAGDLLAFDPTPGVLYANVLAGGGMYELRKIDFRNTASSTVVLAHSIKSFAPGFSFDSNNFYWVEPAAAGGTNKLQSMPKAGAAVSTIRSSSTFAYHAPVSDGTYLYCIRTHVSQGFSEINKIGISSGLTHETASCPFGWSDDRSQNQLLLQSSGIYFTAALGAPPWSLYRSPL